ncbi:MAG: hypothetical protein M0C28_43985 [Candidatus Moduliflexus flocculans]|nr:hypothetical protein [Candidatus Moduliflexus flocculans]
MPVAVTGGLAIYLFGVIGMQGVALIQSREGQPVRAAPAGSRRHHPDLRASAATWRSKDGMFPFIDPGAISRAASRRSCSRPSSAS